MPILYVDHYTRIQIKNNPNTLYVFGDNMMHAGFGGQAKEARGEPNAVGIPTKWAPSKEKSAYFTNDDFPKAREKIDAAFDILYRHLDAGGMVVLPTAGIGRGLAELPVRAPVIHIYINARFDLLQAHAGGK